jgi:hypothetical protein
MAMTLQLYLGEPKGRGVLDSSLSFSLRSDQPALIRTGSGRFFFGYAFRPDPSADEPLVWFTFIDTANPISGPARIICSLPVLGSGAVMYSATPQQGYYFELGLLCIVVPTAEPPSLDVLPTSGDAYVVAGQILPLNRTGAVPAQQR